jgi:hypothetical protein
LSCFLLCFSLKLWYFQTVFQYFFLLKKCLQKLVFSSLIYRITLKSFNNLKNIAWLKSSMLQWYHLFFSLFSISNFFDFFFFQFFNYFFFDMLLTLSMSLWTAFAWWIFTYVKEIKILYLFFLILILCYVFLMFSEDFLIVLSQLNISIFVL